MTPLFQIFALFLVFNLTFLNSAFALRQRSPSRQTPVHAGLEGALKDGGSLLAAGMEEGKGIKRLVIVGITREGGNLAERAARVWGAHSNLDILRINGATPPDAISALNADAVLLTDTRLTVERHPGWAREVGRMLPAGAQLGVISDTRKATSEEIRELLTTLDTKVRTARAGGKKNESVSMALKLALESLADAALANMALTVSEDWVPMDDVIHPDRIRQVVGRLVRDALNRQPAPDGFPEADPWLTREDVLRTLRHNPRLYIEAIALFFEDEARLSLLILEALDTYQRGKIPLYLQTGFGDQADRWVAQARSSAGLEEKGVSEWYGNAVNLEGKPLRFIELMEQKLKNTRFTVQPGDVFKILTSQPESPFLSAYLIRVMEDGRLALRGGPVPAGSVSLTEASAYGFSEIGDIETGIKTHVVEPWDRAPQIDWTLNLEFSSIGGITVTRQGGLVSIKHRQIEEIELMKRIEIRVVRLAPLPAPPVGLEEEARPSRTSLIITAGLEERFPVLRGLLRWEKAGLFLQGQQAPGQVLARLIIQDPTLTSFKVAGLEEEMAAFREAARQARVELEEFTPQSRRFPTILRQLVAILAGMEERNVLGVKGFHDLMTGLKEFAQAA